VGFLREARPDPDRLYLYAGHEIVPNLMRRFHKLYPEVEFSLRNVSDREQVEKIQNGALGRGFPAPARRQIMALRSLRSIASRSLRSCL